jgi:hypothetical protein
MSRASCYRDGFVTVRVARHQNLTVVLFDPYVCRESHMGRWLQWPHWGCYTTYAAHRAQSEWPRSCSGTISASNISPRRCCGNFTASHWICKLSFYLVVSPSIAQPVLREHTMLPPRNNATGHGPPVSPIVSSARKGPPPASSSCERAPMVGRWRPRVPSLSYPRC